MKLPTRTIINSETAKVYPCGKPGNRKLRDRLLHYKMCSHPDCVKRLDQWNMIVDQAKQPGAVRLEK